MPEVQLSQGTVQYRDEGEGPVIVLIHGLLVNSSVWERVIPGLSARARVIAPDLPLGSHRLPMNDGTDLSPPGLASLIAELLQKLDLRDVTIVGNDTGGALCQLVCTRYPDRVGRLVLVNCDAFENFPPSEFTGVVAFLTRVPGAMAGLALATRSAFVRRRSTTAMPLTVTPVDDRLLKQWVEPLRTAGSAATRFGDARTRSQVHARGGRTVARLDRPALIIWGLRDKSSRSPRLSGSPRHSPTLGSSGSRTPARSCSSTNRPGWQSSSGRSPGPTPR